MKIFLRCLAAVVAAVFSTSPVAAQDGFPDAGWNGDGKVLISVVNHVASGYRLAAQPDGRLVLAGFCSTTTGTTYAPCLSRLLATGEIDLSFGPNLNGAFSFDEFDGYPDRTLLGSILLRSDGGFAMAGTSYVPAGSGSGLVGIGNVTQLTSSGRIVLGPSGERARLISLSANPSFPDTYIQGGALLPDGRLILAGSAPRASQVENMDFAIARLNADLSFDTTFNATGPLPGVQHAAFDIAGAGFDSADAVVVQADGKLVAAGIVEANANAREIGVVRLTPDGSLDASFGNNGRVSFDLGGSAECRLGGLTLDGQQRIVLTGSRESDSTTGSTDSFVARLRADNGAFDTSFNGIGYRILALSTAGSFDDGLGGVITQPDGKILAVGYTTVGDVMRATVAIRLLANGNDDPAFGAGGVAVSAFSPTDRSQGLSDVILTPGNRLFSVGSSGPDSSASSIGVMRLTYDDIFGDGFE